MNNQSTSNDTNQVEGSSDPSTNNTTNTDTNPSITSKPTYTTLKTTSINATSDIDTDTEILIDDDEDDEYVQNLHIHPDANKQPPKLPKYIEKNGTKHPFDKSLFISRLFQYMTHGWLYSVVRYGMYSTIIITFILCSSCHRQSS